MFAANVRTYSYACNPPSIPEAIKIKETEAIKSYNLESSDR